MTSAGAATRRLPRVAAVTVGFCLLARLLRTRCRIMWRDLRQYDQSCEQEQDGIVAKSSRCAPINAGQQSSDQICRNRARDRRHRPVGHGWHGSGQIHDYLSDIAVHSLARTAGALQDDTCEVTVIGPALIGGSHGYRLLARG